MGLRDGTLPSHDAPQAADKDPPGPTTSLGAIALGEKDAYPLRDRPGDGGDRKESKTAQRERERKRKREERRRREQGLASPKKDGLPSVEMLDIPSESVLSRSLSSTDRLASHSRPDRTDLLQVQPSLIRQHDRMRERGLSSRVGRSFRLLRSRPRSPR